MNLLVVLPVITPTYADICVDSILMADSAFGIPWEDILVVDNSRDGFAHKYGLRTHRDPDGHNLGVARSWNVGAREVLERNLDYLVILSSVVQFGPILHTTWARQMNEFWGAKVIECDGHSWHLIALHRTCFEKIGLFDTNYYPYAIEQVDWCFRLRMVGWEHGFIRCWVNALSHGHALHVNEVSCPAGPLLDYYADKWGGRKGEETFVQPWGNKPLGFFPERSIPELTAKYNLETWW